MDTFCEQLVEKIPTSNDNAKKLGIYAGAIVIAIAIIFLTINSMFAPIGILLGIGAMFGAYYLGTNLFTEYEYTITNGEIDIDKISGKRSRSRLLTVKVSDFTEFGMYSENIPESDDLTIVLASENSTENDWFADFEIENYGKTRLIFTPNDEFLENIKPFLKNGLNIKKQ